MTTTKVSYVDFHHWKNAAGLACYPNNFEFRLLAMEKRALDVLQNTRIKRVEESPAPTHTTTATSQATPAPKSVAIPMATVYDDLDQFDDFNIATILDDENDDDLVKQTLMDQVRRSRKTGQSIVDIVDADDADDDDDDADDYHYDADADADADD